MNLIKKFAIAAVAASLLTGVVLAQNGNIVATGNFHGAAHKISGSCHHLI